MGPGLIDFPARTGRGKIAETKGGVLLAESREVGLQVRFYSTLGGGKSGSWKILIVAVRHVGIVFVGSVGEGKGDRYYRRLGLNFGPSFSCCYWYLGVSVL